MTGHRFKVGEQVQMDRSFGNRRTPGVYEIIRLLPEDMRGDLQYRIVGTDRVERAALESELSALNVE